MGGPTESLTLNTCEWTGWSGPSRRDEGVCSLSDILETGDVPRRFYLSARACRGILRRAEKRGKELPVSYSLRAKRPSGVAHAIAPIIAARTRAGGGLGTDFDCDGGLIAFDARQSDVIQYGNKTGQLDTDGRTVAFAIQERAVCENPDAGPDGVGVRDDGAAYTLEARTVPQAVAFAQNSRDELGESDVMQSLKVGGGKPGQSYPAIRQGWAVRRLTPLECERLMGFPDGYTAIPYRGKPTADGPRYKALGNSMAVNVVRWIGQRIDLVETALQSDRAAA
jgi:hypothetical protein